MNTTHTLSHSETHSEDASHSIEYRIVYRLVFAVCLTVALLCRLFPRRWHPWASETGKRLSLLEEARSATESTVPYVFQI